MKKILTSILALVAVIAAVALFSKPSANEDFLRIHIRADSNQETDQIVKYKVKSAVVQYLTPYLATADTKDKALSIAKMHLDGICSVADKVLSDNGFCYTSSAEICQENFPTRTYDGVTLQSGVYDALILNLGSGSGDNWWCVVYPPLCFVGVENDGSGDIVFRSKLMEIINKWKSTH